MSKSGVERVRRRGLMNTNQPATRPTACWLAVPLTMKWMQRSKVFVIPVARTVELFSSWLTKLRSSPELPQDVIDDVLRQGRRICTHEGRKSFTELAGGVCGTPYFDEMLPGPLHLLIRTVEKIISLDAVEKHILSNDEAVAIDSFLAAGVAIKYFRGRLSKFNVESAAGHRARQQDRHSNGVTTTTSRHVVYPCPSTNGLPQHLSGRADAWIGATSACAEHASVDGIRGRGRRIWCG